MKTFPRLSMCLGFVVCVGVAAAPKIEEVVVGPTNRGGAFVVAPAGAHVAYAGVRGGKVLVSVDGVEGPEFDELMKAGGSGFVPPERAAIYRGQQDGLKYGDAPVVFSADGEHYAYMARAGEDYVVIHDGKEIGRGPRAKLATGTLNGVLRITPRGRHVVWNEFERSPNGQTSYVRRVVSGKRGPLSQGMVPADIVFSDDESRYVYSIGQAVDTGKPMLVVDGKDAGYAGESPAISADGALVLSISFEPERSGVLVNGKLAYKGSVTSLVTAPTGRRWAAIVNKIPAAGGLPGTALVVDGKEVPDGEHVQNVWFSPDGKRYAARCHNPYGRHPWVMVIDGQGYEFARIDPQAPLWTADSSKVIFTAGTDTSGVLVVNDDVHPYSGNPSPVTLAATGDRFAWGTADHRTRRYAVIVGGEAKLPGGLYPMSKVVLSPDGGRSGFLVGQVGRNQLAGVVIDGAVVPGVMPGTFLTRLTDMLDASEPLVFSRKEGHVAFVGRTATAPKNALHVDGKGVYTAPGALYYVTFTPDGRHLFWLADEPGPVAGPHHVLYLDGEPAVRGNARFFAEVRSFDVDERGTGAVLLADGDVAKRIRVTPAAADGVALLLAKGSAVASGVVPAAPEGDPAPAAPSSSPPRITGKLTAASAAPAEALSWADLVRRPETRPAQCAVRRDFRFQGGAAVRAGTVVNVLEFKPAELVVGTPDGRTNFGVKPEETDIVAVANAAWAKLSPAQRELTLAALLRRMDLWPYHVRLLLPFELEGRRTRVGDEAILLRVEGAQLLVRLPGTPIAFDVDPGQTDLLEQARATLLDPRGARGRVREELAGKTVSPLDGRAIAPAPEARPKYVLMYMGAGWCGPCQQFAPRLVQLLKTKAPAAETVEMYYLSGDRSPAEARAYASKLGIGWPTLFFRTRDQLPSLAPLFGDSIPQLVVTDRHGRVLIDSAKVGTDRALAELGRLL